MLHRVAICYKPDGNALEQHGNALEQKKHRSSPHKLYLCRRNKKVHAMLKTVRKMKHSWQRMICGMADTFSHKKTYSDKDVINLILYCSEEKAKALLKEGPDSMEAKSMSTYIDTLYDILIRRKQQNKS